MDNMSRNTIAAILFPLSVGFGEQKQMLGQVLRIKSILEFLNS